MNLHLLFLAIAFKSSSMKMAFEAPVFLYSVQVASIKLISSVQKKSYVSHLISIPPGILRPS